MRKQDLSFAMLQQIVIYRKQRLVAFAASLVSPCGTRSLPISTASPVWCACGMRRKRLASVWSSAHACHSATTRLICSVIRRIAAWGRLTRLLTVGKDRVPHGDTSDAAKATNRCFRDHDDLLEHGEGQILLAVMQDRLDADARKNLQQLQADFCGRAYLAASRRYRADDAQRLRAMAALSLPMVATNDVLYHLPDRRPLQDVMTCIRLGCRIDQAGLALQPNAERDLKSPSEMARPFHDHPDAILRTQEIVERCSFSLGELAYEYPDEPIPLGLTPDEHLANPTGKVLRCAIPMASHRDLRHHREGTAHHRAPQLRAALLTVHDIVRYESRTTFSARGVGRGQFSRVLLPAHNRCRSGADQSAVRALCFYRAS